MIDDDELPAPVLRPFAPPDGAFDAVVTRAKARRRRRLAVTSAAVLLPLALLGVVMLPGGGEEEPVETAAEEVTDTTTTAAVGPVETAAASTTVVSAAPTTTSTTDVLAEAEIDPTEGEEGPVGTVPQVDEPAAHRGVVTDPQGNPLAGIFVYLNFAGMFSDAVTTTAADGSYVVPCGPVPLLLWGTGPDFRSPPDASRNWEPATVGTASDADGYAAPPCMGEDEPPTVTMLVPGVTLTGLLLDAEGNPRRNMVEHFTLGVNGRFFFAPVYGTDADGRYWLYGIEAGQVRLTNNGVGDRTVEAAPGEVLFVDWQVSTEPGTEGVTLPVVPGTPP